jgi:hypothetical protein
VGKIDDVEHAEYDRQPEAQYRIETAIDKAEHQLAHKGLQRYAEYFHGFNVSD